MPKRKKGKNKSEEDKKKETNTLAVGKYTEKFENMHLLFRLEDKKFRRV